MYVSINLEIEKISLNSNTNQNCKTSKKNSPYLNIWNLDNRCSEKNAQPLILKLVKKKKKQSKELIQLEVQK